MSLTSELENDDRRGRGYRYRDRAEVVAAGVALLQERDAARAAFLAWVMAPE